VRLVPFSLIYATAENTSYLIRADTGEIIESQLTPDALRKLEPRLSTFTSPASISPDYFEMKVLSEDTVLMPNGSVRDRQIGDVLWNKHNTSSSSVSNIDTTETTAYALTSDGQLVGYDLRTGEVVTLVQFDPRSFPSNDPERYAISYSVAVDKNLGLIYAYLGDSKQLFAFKIVDYPETELD